MDFWLIGNRLDTPVDADRIANPTYVMHHIWWPITETPGEPIIFQTPHPNKGF